jgi:beta-fructofuranosidase
VTHAGGGTDPHFPLVHIRPPRGWVNDPNGPIWHRGRFHLFFQYTNMVPPEMAKVVWAHSSSADLAHWEIHGVALAPSDQHPGVEGFWSGNTVEDEGRLFAFYAAYRRSERYQPPRITASDDGGQSFSEDRPVLAPPEESEGVEMFRDPFVWHQDGRWRLLMGSGLADGTAPQARLYESEELFSWETRGVFASVKRNGGEPYDSGLGWECPQYAWEMGVLFVGAWRPDVGTMNVLAIKGSEQNGRLVVDGVEPADYGPDFYAPSLMRAPDGRYLLWGVVKEGRSREWRDESGWAGMLSLPREVSLDAGRLVSRPARELASLRGELCCEYSGSSAELLFAEVPRAFELRLRLIGCTTASVALEFGGSEVLSIQLDGAAGEVVIDREKASADARAHGGRTTIGPVAGLFASGTAELIWFVDHSVSELFLADTIVATTRFFPTSAATWQIRVTTADVCVVEARLWALRPSVRLAAGPLDMAKATDDSTASTPKPPLA